MLDAAAAVMVVAALRTRRVGPWGVGGPFGWLGPGWNGSDGMRSMRTGARVGSTSEITWSSDSEDTARVGVCGPSAVRRFLLAVGVRSPLNGSSASSAGESPTFESCSRTAGFVRPRERLISVAHWLEASSKEPGCTR